MVIAPYSEHYRDDMIFMILQAKDALGVRPRINEDLLDIRARYLAKGDMLLLAVDGDDRVVGSVGSARLPGAAEAFLHRLYVKPSRQRRGIGTALLRAAENGLRGEGVAVARVHLGAPRDTWSGAYAFYHKHGYREYAGRYMLKTL